jgi:hypothetical protein
MMVQSQLTNIPMLGYADELHYWRAGMEKQGARKLKLESIDQRCAVHHLGLRAVIILYPPGTIMRSKPSKPASASQSLCSCSVYA